MCLCLMNESLGPQECVFCSKFKKIQSSLIHREVGSPLALKLHSQWTASGLPCDSCLLWEGWGAGLSTQKPTQVARANDPFLFHERLLRAICCIRHCSHSLLKMVLLPFQLLEMRKLAQRALAASMRSHRSRGSE